MKEDPAARMSRSLQQYREDPDSVLMSLLQSGLGLALPDSIRLGEDILS